MPIWEKFMMKVYDDQTLGYEKGPFDRPINPLNTIIDCELYEEVLNPSDTTEYNVVDEDDFM